LFGDHLNGKLFPEIVAMKACNLNRWTTIPDKNFRISPSKWMGKSPFRIYLRTKQLVGATRSWF
jgi:hypothetical protein